jgi:oligopeptide transport system permease protein
VGKYIVRRLLQMIPVIIGATFLIFAMVFALPGDPLAGKCGERPCPPAYAAEVPGRAQPRRPAAVQYAKYVGNLARGISGTTTNGIPVLDELQDALPGHRKLAVMALAFEASSASRRCAAGIRKGKFIDNLVLVSTLVVISIPIFVIGWCADFLGVKLGWFPVTVSSNPTFYELLLPAWCSARSRWPTCPPHPHEPGREPARRLRAHRRRQGVCPERRAIGVHALRNSMIPVITFIGLRLRRPARWRHRHRAHLQHPGASADTSSAPSAPATAPPSSVRSPCSSSSTCSSTCSWTCSTACSTQGSAMTDAARRRLRDRRSQGAVGRAVPRVGRLAISCARTRSSGSPPCSSRSSCSWRSSRSCSRAPTPAKAHARRSRGRPRATALVRARPPGLRRLRPVRSTGPEPRSSSGS